jgi:hypothetical protein
VKVEVAKRSEGENKKCNVPCVALLQGRALTGSNASSKGTRLDAEQTKEVTLSILHCSGDSDRSESFFLPRVASDPGNRKGSRQVQ